MIKTFSDFIKPVVVTSINESKTVKKHKKKCTIIFVTKNPTSETSHGEFSRFRESAKKFGVNIFGVDPDKVKYRLTESGSLEINDIGTFNKNEVIFFFRHSIRYGANDADKKVSQTNVKNLKSLLKSNGFYVSNDSKVATICKSKLKTFELLKKHNVSTIETVHVDRHFYESRGLKSIPKLEKFLSSESLSFPLVVKVDDGTQGTGIFKCPDVEVLASIVQYLVKTKGECIIQPFCEIDYDVRVHVFCKTLNPQTAKVDDFITIGSMKRGKAVGDFRTNYSVGGQISEYELSKEEEKLSKEAAKAIGSVWCGIDICKDNISGKYYVIECNSSPALAGISSVSSETPTDLMVKEIKKTLTGNKKSDDISKIHGRELVSYYETVTMDGIPVRGMFDTGNSSNPAFKSEKFEIDDDKVTFEIMGQEVTKKIVKMKSILHSGVKSEPRPIVKIDLGFNGRILKDVEICVRGLTENEKEREKKTGKKIGGTRILLSTDIIDKLNLIVHPDRDEKFMKTDKPKQKKK